jgi:hypothetical protein
VHALFESLIDKNKKYTPKNLSEDQVDSLKEEFRM